MAIAILITAAAASLRHHAATSSAALRAISSATGARHLPGFPTRCTHTPMHPCAHCTQPPLTYTRAMSSNAYPPPDTSRAGTADLCDVHHPEAVDDIKSGRKVNIAQPIFRDFGGNIRFSGKISTVLCYENNPLVRKALEEPGQGRVLVVDGGASLRCALLGDQIAAMAAKNQWSGIIINGCIRDSEDIGKMALGVKALNTFPLKSSKRDPGLRDVPVSFAGVSFTPGHWLYADKDGVLVSPTELSL